MEEQNKNFQDQNFEDYNLENNNLDEQEPVKKQKPPMPPSAVAVMVISIIVAVSCIIPMIITLLATGGEPVMYVDENCYLVVDGVTTEYKVHNFGDNWEIYGAGAANCEENVFYRFCYQCEAIDWRQGAYEDHHFYRETDNLYHWEQCQNCEYFENKTAHTPNDDGICEVCSEPVGTEGLLYEVSSDGTYAIVTGYVGSESQIMIAGKYNGLPVKAIKESAFYANRNITAVVIPNSVTSIGNRAFYYCANLSEVVIPNSVTYIGNQAFYSCNDALYSYHDTGKYVRSGNDNYAVLIELTSKNITYCEIYKGTKIIANEVFKNCTKLTSISIPNSVTTICEYAFYNCTLLKEVSIADSVTFIGNYAFQLCVNLREIKLPAGLKAISKYTFYNCPNLASVVIPKSVTSIGEHAFAACNALKNVYYAGSESAWQRVTVEKGNTPLTNADISYNSSK